MSARRASYLILFFAMAATALFYNNCAGRLSTTDVGSAESSSQSSSGSNMNLAAHVDSISTDGRVYGYAMNANSKSSYLKVLFYSGGPAGTGTYIGEAVANVASVGTFAGHYFSYQLPAALANGKAQVLYVYVLSAKPENLISPSPMNFAAYTPKAESFFNQNIAPFTGGDCVRCHGWTYKSLYFGPLINPSPFNGGSATNNRLIRKIGGLEGHGGGNFCPGGLDTGYCASIQAWWHAEFD